MMKEWIRASRKAKGGPKAC